MTVKDVLDEATDLEEGIDHVWADKFLEFINRKLRNGSRCDKCKRGSLGLLEHAVAHVTWDSNKNRWVLDENRNYPFAIIMCDYCGHSSLFNLVKAGIHPEDFK